MALALLIVIVLVLLFGAGVVKGWLANIAGLGCGGLAILAALLWLGSFFGENGFTYIIYGVCALLFALLIAGLIFQTWDGSSESPAQRGPSTHLRDKVWQRWSGDIEHNFGAEARQRARQLYNENNAPGLDDFCRKELIRKGSTWKP